MADPGDRIPPSAAGRGGPAAVATAVPVQEASGRRLRTFDSIADVPAFRWYLASMAGHWSALQMQQVARSFIAYYLTGSFAALGFIELANTFPRLFLALYGGVVADRASRRVILQAGQMVNAFLAAGVAALLFLGQLRIEHLVLAAFGQGVLNSFVMPARQAMIPEIVGAARLTNAFALNVFTLNVLRLGAPALAGVMLALVGAGWVFLVMVVLNLVAVVLLFPIPKLDARSRAGVARDASPHRDRTGLRSMKEGFAYLNRTRLILWLIAIHGTTQMLTLPYQRLLPGFIDEVLANSKDQTAVYTGVLLSLTAVGALVGSLLIASLPDRQRGKLLIYSLGVFGVTLVALSVSNALWLSAGIVLVLGVGQSMRQSLANILIQSRIDDLYRGRVSSIMLMDDGLESLGIFSVAILADLAGSEWAFGAVGVGLLAYGIGLWFSRPIRELD